MAGGTAAAWGRSAETRSTLFVTTAGRTGLPVKGRVWRLVRLVALKPEVEVLHNWICVIAARKRGG